MRSRQRTRRASRRWRENPDWTQGWRLWETFGGEKEVRPFAAILVVRPVGRSVRITHTNRTSRICLWTVVDSWYLANRPRYQWIKRPLATSVLSCHLGWITQGTSRAISHLARAQPLLPWKWNPIIRGDARTFYPVHPKSKSIAASLVVVQCGPHTYVVPRRISLLVIKMLSVLAGLEASYQASTVRSI